MNDLIQKLLEALRGTSAGTKFIALLAGAGLVAVIGLAGAASKRPDFQLAFSGLSDHEVAKVNKALAQAGIAFTSSSPPSPFNVYVDEADRSAAFAAAYGAGALDKPLQGIISESGVASVFNSAEERRQGVRKKEWQEMESMLESLEFVSSAHVRTSPQANSTLAARNAAPMTASVVLRTGEDLTQSQEDTIARMVSNGLGVQREFLVISDHEGRSLYDGSLLSDEATADDHLERQAEYDARMTMRADQLLEAILGPGKARVTVTTDWNYEQSTRRSESTEKGQVIEESKQTTDRPVQATTSVAGLSSNIPPVDGQVMPGAEPSAPGKETTSDEKKTYRPSTTVEERVNVVPQVARLTVALYLDSSIDAAQAEQLTAAVKASVGFDEKRNDHFSSVSLPFFVPEVVEQEADLIADVSEPNPLMETLLRRGVEVLTAVAFLVLLMKTLKSSKASSEELAEEVPQEHVDPEILARATVDELLKSDPERAGELLSNWALEEQAA